MSRSKKLHFGKTLNKYFLIFAVIIFALVTTIFFWNNARNDLVRQQALNATQESTIDELESQIMSLESLNSQLNDENSELQKQIDNLESDISDMEDTQSQSSEPTRQSSSLSIEEACGPLPSFSLPKVDLDKARQAHKACTDKLFNR